WLFQKNMAKVLSAARSHPVGTKDEQSKLVIVGEVSDDWGWSRRSLQSYVDRRNDADVAESAMPIPETGIPWWIYHPASPAMYESTRSACLAFGWPCRCLRMNGRDGMSDRVLLQTRQGLVAVPTQIVWYGLVANTVVFGAPVFLVGWGRGAARRWGRRR